MFGAIAMLFLVPWLDTSKVRSAVYRPWYKLFYWLFVADAVLPRLARLAAGGRRLCDRWRRLATLYYFAFFLVMMPLLGLIETPRKLPNSITEAVLEKTRARGAASGRRHGGAGAQGLSDLENLRRVQMKRFSEPRCCRWSAGGRRTAGTSRRTAHNAAAPTHFPINEPKEIVVLRRPVRHLRQGRSCSAA